MSDFHLTKLGQKFFEVTLPKIASELARLNTNLESLLAEIRFLREDATSPPGVPPATATNSDT